MDEQKKKAVRRRVPLLLLLLLILLCITSCTAGYVLGKIGNLEWYSSKIIDVISITPKQRNNAGAPNFQAIDGKTADIWGQSTLVGIFSSSPERGVSYVRGQTVIAPGAKGTYVFRLQNLERFDIEYDLSLIDSDMNNPKLPLKYRLKFIDTGVYASGEEWKPAGEIHIDGALLSAEGTEVLSLEWEWQEESDKIDTEIGMQQELPLYILEIIINGQFQ